jgi:surface protein
MKTKLLLGLATAAMLTACSNDELVRVNTDSSNVIGFSTFVNKSTRATDIDNENIGGEKKGVPTKGFSVYGWTAAKDGTAKDFDKIFDNEAVTGTNYGTTGEYSYTNLQYWEEGNKYSFHALAPYGSDDNDASTYQRHWLFEQSGDNNEIATISFVNIADNIAEKANGDQDLVYGYAYVKEAEKSGNSKVEFDFAHLLSRVKFLFIGADNNPENVTIEVTDVKLNGSYKSGKIKIANSTASEGVTTPINKSTSETIDASDWDFTGQETGDIDYEEGLNSFSTVASTGNNNQTYTNHKYVIPVNGSKEYTATVKLKLTAKVSGSEDTHEYTPEKVVKLLPVTMDKGKSYVYQIKVDVSSASTDYIDPILFNVDVVTAWDKTWEPVKEPITVKVKRNSATRAESTADISVLGNYTFTDYNKEKHTYKFDLEQVEKIVIDGKEQKSVEYAYNLSTDEVHIVKIYMKDNVISASGMFANCSDITEIGFSDFDTSNITDMAGMFYNCSGLTSLDLSKFDTSNVTNMSYMFFKCSGLTSLDISGFDTSEVTTMRYMFYDCSSLASLDVSNFKTSNVTDMTDMFFNFPKLTSLDVTNFITSNVIKMSSMFYGCSGLTSLDVTNFDTSNVTDMNCMFCCCNDLTSLDLSKFDTSKVTNMSWMFYGCNDLNEIRMNGSLEALTTYNDMFTRVPSTGTFYYPSKDENYTKIINQSPISNWTKDDINNAPKQQ